MGPRRLHRAPALRRRRGEGGSLEPGGGWVKGRSGGSRWLRGAGVVAAAAVFLAGAPLRAPAQVGATEGNQLPPPHDHRHALEAFPIGPAVGIYSLQYLRELSPGNELILGVAYVNVKNDVGQFFSPTFPVGYRRSLGWGMHAEYQLWPAYAVFFEKEEREFYRGFDLYNEVRAGYVFDLPARGVPLILTLQYVFGFGLYPGNKPDSFTEWARDNRYFHAPVFFFGFRF